LIHALETASPEQKKQLVELMNGQGEKKVEQVLSLFRQCKVGEWANELKERFISEAFTHLEDVAVISKRKEPLKQLALFLTQRQN
jgi:geranylgeranyl diphosphate synthase type II